MNLGLAYPAAMSLVSGHRETRADSLATKPKWQILRHGAIPWAVGSCLSRQLKTRHSFIASIFFGLGICSQGEGFFAT
jgi:hypothetical protein